MLGGNLWALSERSVKRMLAYSSIAHAGYLLVAVVAAGSGSAIVRDEATSGMLFYLATYTAAAAGAFGAVSLMERLDPNGPQPWDLERFTGLAQRRPWIAIAMTVLLLSLAGIPPTAGFMGKLLVFRAAVDAGQVWLAVVGVMSALIGLYYYLRIVVYMFMRPATQQFAPAAPRSWPADLALLSSAAAALWFGVLSGPLAAAAQAAGAIFGG
jgi:NADH-quinone oxidoreductase subunit N